MNMTTNRPAYPPLSIIAAVVVSFLMLLDTYKAPMVLVLLVLYFASFLFPYRMQNSTSSVWALRILIYGAIAVIGRGDLSGPRYLFDLKAYSTAGLLAGGEVVLQSWLKTPAGYRFDPILILLTGVVFLISTAVTSANVALTAPLFMICILFALNDVRPTPGPAHSLALMRRIAFLGIAVALGAVTHQLVWANRGQLMSLGVKLLAGRHAGQSSAGVGDTSSLGNGTFNAAQSTARLMRIQGPLKDPHLRAAAFDEYRNGSWGPAMSTRKLISATDGAINGSMRGPYTDITVMRDTNGFVFFPLNAIALVPSTGTSFDWLPTDGPVKTEEPAPYTYHLLEGPVDDRVGIPLEQGPLTSRPSGTAAKEYWQRLLTVPQEIGPGVLQITAEVTAKSNTPAAKTVAIAEYLLDNYKYSLDFVRGQDDPVTDFLLNKKPAHCQYFASAAVMMLRASGVPARYVTGYYANEIDESGQLVVRQRDAHAWAEAYVQGVGWVVVEATPPSGRADPQTAPLSWVQKKWEQVQDGFTALRTWIGNLTQLQISLILGVFAVLWGLERWRVSRRNRTLIAGPMPPLELAPIARRFERVLARSGVEVVPSAPWSERIPVDWPEAAQFVEHYNTVRFGSIERADLEKLEQLVQEAETSARNRPRQPSVPADGSP